VVQDRFLPASFLAFLAFSLALLRGGCEVGGGGGPGGAALATTTTTTAPTATTTNPATTATTAAATSSTTDPDTTTTGSVTTTTRSLTTTTKSLTTTTAATSPAPSVLIKPVVQGLCDRAHTAPAAYLGVVNCAVVKADWAALQPARGGPIADNNVIDQAIAEANQRNAADPGLRLRLKLRVYAGMAAPEWAKHLDGDPVPLVDPQTGGAIGTVPRFWTSTFGAAYDDLMTKLAARYDNVPVLLDVVVSRCTTQFAEPFLRQGQNAANREAYLSAGFTIAADHRCLQEQIDTHARVWQHTRSSVAFNPYQSMDARGTHPDEAFTEAMMGYCRSALGSRCVLGNNSISSPLDGGAYTPMYARIFALGAPFYFQTATAAKIGDWRATLDWAAGHGADMVELPAGYDTWPLSELAAYDARL
jgi:hypothetical protein